MNKEVKNVVAKSQFSIVNEVAVMLNLGDFGKVEGFIRKTAKTLEREIETAERSIVNEKHNTKSKLSSLTEKLEDARQSVEEAYTNLDPELLKTNDAQRKFMETYLSDLDAVEAVVAGIEEEIKDAKEVSVKVIEKLGKEVAVRQTRIARLTKGTK
jgi:predicted  nucleic acid-binding Zn-ribbon protein